MIERELRVLFVDVSASDTELVVRELQRRRRTRWRRVDDREAFEDALARADWDAVVADIHTPHLEPPRACAVLLARKRDIPLIAVAATADPDEIAAALAAGARDFVCKAAPVRLPFAIERELALRRSRTELDELRKRVKDLREAVQARDCFLSMASHELRTPLTPLTLQIDRLARMLEPDGEAFISRERLLDMIKVMRRQCDRLIELVKNLLDVSRITAGKLALHREPVDLAAVVCQVRDDFSEAIEASQTSIELHAPAGIVGNWDGERIKSVVENLLSNALKYGGGRPIAVRLFNHGAAVHLEVADHGIGISRGDQERIFDRFERAVSTVRYGGLGIGLWIVRQVVEAHGGTITVASAPGSGTTFVVTLPKSISAGETSQPHTPPE